MIRIEVTREDIDKGVPGDPCRCPIALAAGRRFGGNPSVTYREIWKSLEGHERLGKLPPEAVEFATNFDEHLPVEPMSFWPVPIELDPIVRS